MRGKRRWRRIHSIRIINNFPKQWYLQKCLILSFVTSSLTNLHSPSSQTSRFRAPKVEVAVSLLVELTHNISCRTYTETIRETRTRERLCLGLQRRQLQIPNGLHQPILRHNRNNCLICSSQLGRLKEDKNSKIWLVKIRKSALDAVSKCVLALKSDN